MLVSPRGKDAHRRRVVVRMTALTALHHLIGANLSRGHLSFLSLKSSVVEYLVVICSYLIAPAGCFPGPRVVREGFEHLKRLRVHPSPPALPGCHNLSRERVSLSRFGVLTLSPRSPHYGSHSVKCSRRYSDLRKVTHQVNAVSCRPTRSVTDHRISLRIMALTWVEQLGIEPNDRLFWSKGVPAARCQ